MDDLANLVQDVKYEGELSNPRLKPFVNMPLLPDSEIEAKKLALQNAKTDEDTGLKPLDFENLMREYLGYYMVTSIDSFTLFITNNINLLRVNRMNEFSLALQ